VRGVLADEGVAVSEIFFAYCPERVLPGRIMTELRENDRIVGGLSPEAADKVAAFYRTFVTGAVLVSDARTAEMAKLTENSFRDVNIAFANELSLLCEGLGIDVWELISLANRHPRVNILQPGCGVGGHCIAVDPWFIVSQDPKNARMIRTAREVNLHKTEWVVDQVRQAAAEATEQLGRAPVVACLGLAFKPNIDDLRESPALEITEHLLHGDEKNAALNVLAVEPNIHEHDKLPLRTLEDGLKESDIVVILVNHLAFKGMNLEGKIVLDFCGFGR
jgi:UDP-N-acetyl-D-mannosaminuronic acid dehydrogenase